MLCAAAAVTIGLPPLRMPSSPTTAELLLAALAFVLSLIAFLSPEIGEILVRLGYSEPCELRRPPVGRTLTALHASAQWRRYAGQVSAAAPDDVWREGCWRFVVYPDPRADGASTSSSPSTSRPAAAHPGGDPRRGHRRGPGPAGTRESVVI